MVRHVRFANHENPARLVSMRHASATVGQTRLIRLARPANDNRTPRSRWVPLTATALTLLILVLSLI
jgi:hypothetical protein